MTGEKHIFALYVTDLASVISGTNVVISDESCVHRIAHVLRLQPNDHLIVFDRMCNATVQITSITKKAVGGTVIAKEDNAILEPYITFLLPVLKKDALSDAVYNATEVGANAIQLVYTEKTQRSVSSHELDRLERRAIAAAEQCKQFAVPGIAKPLALQELVESTTGTRIFFDPSGYPASKVINELQHIRPDALTMLIGPEGDLTHQEKQILIDYQWTFCALGPTILRSVQATALGIGAIRSMLFMKAS